MVALDSDGYLKNLAEWNEQVAQQLALQEGITLGASHWEVLLLMRGFYEEFGLSPAMRPLIKYIRQHLGEQKGSSIYLLTLFPGSPAKLAAKLAGLPRPANCL